MFRKDLELKSEQYKASNDEECNKHKNIEQIFMDEIDFAIKKINERTLF